MEDHSKNQDDKTSHVGSDHEDVGSVKSFKEGEEKDSVNGPTQSTDLIHTSHSTMSSISEPLVTMDSKRTSHSSHLESNLVENGSTSGLKSPLSQRRISTSSLDDVSLLDELPLSKEVVTSESTTASILTRFSRSSTVSSQIAPTNTSGIPKSSSPAPTLRRNATPTAPTPVQEKPTTVRRSPFSWLSRASTSKEPAPKDVPKSRRATNASVLSNSSTTTTSTILNSELLLARIEANKECISKADLHEKEELLKGTDSLRENFRRIREREGTLQSRPGTAQAEVTNEAEPVPATISLPVSTEDQIDWDLWQAVIEDPYKVVSTMPNELNQAIQAGIPQTIRGTVWQSMAQSKCTELEGMYHEVLDLGPQATAVDARPLFGNHWPPVCPASPSLGSSILGSPNAGSPQSETSYSKAAFFTGEWAKKTVVQLEKVIKKDLGNRTSFGKYKVDQKALLNICKAYALFDPEIGYTQGMTFVATPLLMNMAEEEAFCLFVRLMCRYNLRSMFQEKMKGLGLRLYQFDRLVENVEPRLSVHLKRQGIESSLYAAQWFLTLFTYKFPLQPVLRVFDLVFSEGVEGAVLKFGIVLMTKNADALLGKDFESLGPFLKEKLFDVYLDAAPSATLLKEAGFFGNGGEKDVYRANSMVQDACSVKITREMLIKYEAEWVEAERIKRTNELEIENLKHSNAQLATRVKKLEEELELVNKEHIDLLNSMVVKNMENSHLADENTDLVQQVEELKKIVESQPMEVEAKYKAELDRLMERQLEVHQENQSLEEQMIEMEKELVNTKMKLAEVSQSHDILKNKWSDLRRAVAD